MRLYIATGKEKSARTQVSWTLLRDHLSNIAIKSPHLLALADQAVASATSFLILVAIARYSNASDVGMYSFALSLVAVALLVQEALVLTPYSIHFQRIQPADGADEGSYFVSLVVLVVVIILGTLGCLLASYILGISQQIAAVSQIVIILAPGVVMREFVKRVDLAHLRVGRVLCLDVTFSCLVAFSMAVTVHFGFLSAAMAATCISFGSVVSAYGWFPMRREALCFDRARTISFIREHLRVGSWYLVSQTAALIRGWITFWLLYSFEGEISTGVFAACTSIAAFGNPILYGLNNILPGRSSKAWTTGGSKALLKQAVADSALLAAALGCVGLVLAFAGERLLDSFFAGPEFQNHGKVILLLALSSLATGIGLPANRALAIIQKPRAVVAASLTGTIATIGAVLIFVLEWSVFGAALGLLIGNMTGSICRWVALLALLPKDANTTPICDLIQAESYIEKDAGIKLSRLGEGDYGITYAAFCKDDCHRRRFAPDSLVIKQFKVADQTIVEDAKIQFDAMKQLHRILHGTIATGWTIKIPVPIRYSQEPLAILMTKVSGLDLLAMTESSSCQEELLDSISAAIAESMTHCWNKGFKHGDFGLQNILCDSSTKTLSLIDPGGSKSCLDCFLQQDATKAAASDLGHLLADLCADASVLTGSPRVYIRRRRIVVNILRCAAKLNAERNTSAYLATIKISILAHLEKKLRRSITPRGLWHCFVHYIAVQSMNNIFDTAFTDLSAKGATTIAIK